MGKVVDESQEMDFILQVVDVGDGTNDGSRNSPKDDQYADKGESSTVTNDALPPLDAKISPDNLRRVESDVARGHVQWQVVSDRLVGSLSIGLLVEFHKDRRDELAIASTVLGLQLLDFRAESLNLGTSPVDSVDFLANEELKTVGRAILSLNPLGSNGARLVIELANGLILVTILSSGPFLAAFSGPCCEPCWP
jgi:hypothetical protein